MRNRCKSERLANNTLTGLEKISKTSLGRSQIELKTDRYKHFAGKMPAAKGVKRSASKASSSSSAATSAAKNKKKRVGM